MTPSNWFDALHQCQQQGTAYVIVTVLGAAGSTPRASGTKMVICPEQTYDTIGGGHLEYAVTEHARQLLLTAKHAQHVEHYPLSSKLGQCCGGAVNVLYEVMVEHGQSLLVFGAGHVAHALVPLLAQLPMNIRWIDQRPELFATDKQTPLSNNVQIIVSDDPSEQLALAPANSWAVIMTHSHQLDYALVEAALKREDFNYVGMIGSHTKAKRFKTRLTHKLTSLSRLERFVSPIGLLDIPGKRPIEVAVSIAAQLIQRLNSPGQQDPSDEVKDQQDDRAEQVRAWRNSKQLKSLI